MRIRLKPVIASEARRETGGGDDATVYRPLSSIIFIVIVFLISPVKTSHHSHAVTRLHIIRSYREAQMMTSRGGRGCSSPQDTTFP